MKIVRPVPKRRDEFPDLLLSGKDGPKAVFSQSCVFVSQDDDLVELNIVAVSNLHSALGEWLNGK